MEILGKLFPIVIMAALLAGCSQREGTSALDYFKGDTAAVKTGGIKIIPIETPKGRFNVWTKRFGNNPRMKLLLLHGGPGATHEYFECFESFFPSEGIEFIYYDQLGSAYSDQPQDTDLWEVGRFVEEVEQVRRALGLNRDNFFLLGHSWGGILATEYALKYQDRLKGLIISNMMSCCPSYDAYAENVLAKQMDPVVLEEIRNLEAKGEFQNPRYMELLVPNYYMQHICRLAEWPDPVNRAFAHINQEVYVTMQGPSEFGISGRLEKWDRKSELKSLSVPTLVIGARYDTMDPEHMKWMAEQVQNGSYLFCPNGSHMGMYDDQEIYVNGLIAFIKAVDGGKKKIDF
ncbi:MAG: proline iminopeptidase-family hydrolase [Candidatus Aminicenantes bacterium]|nr:proline iminopeptidase-family hydrolase [Candidatus Aminicenantes bacterium]